VDGRVQQAVDEAEHTQPAFAIVSPDVLAADGLGALRFVELWSPPASRSRSPWPQEAMRIWCGCRDGTSEPLKPALNVGVSFVLGLS